MIFVRLSEYFVLERLVSDKGEVCLRNIHTKWEKISDQEASGMKTKSDLVSQVQTKHSLNKDQVQKDVDSWANGRDF